MESVSSICSLSCEACHASSCRVQRVESGLIEAIPSVLEEVSAYPFRNATERDEGTPSVEMVCDRVVRSDELNRRGIRLQQSI